MERYYLSYSWSPWNALFMEDCNIVTYNLGLHYYVGGGRPTNGKYFGQPKYLDDFKGALTYLVDFVASKGKVYCLCLIVTSLCF